MLTIKEFNNCANKSEFCASFEVISKNMLRFAPKESKESRMFPVFLKNTIPSEIYIINKIKFWDKFVV